MTLDKQNANFVAKPLPSCARCALSARRGRICMEEICEAVNVIILGGLLEDSCVGDWDAQTKL